jgi:hypothetical protein
MIQKIKKQDDSAFSRNNGESVKYRIRKQEEKEYNDLLKEFVERPSEQSEDDFLGGGVGSQPGY